MVSVLVFVESTFNVRIPDKDAVPDNFDTVTKIANLVIKHKK
jgi:acyl carrier protein